MINQLKLSGKPGQAPRSLLLVMLFVLCRWSWLENPWHQSEMTARAWRVSSTSWRERTSHSKLLKNAPATAWAKHHPILPSDCRSRLGSAPPLDQTDR